MGDSGGGERGGGGGPCRDPWAWASFHTHGELQDNSEKGPHTFSALNKLWHKGVKVVFVQVCVCLSSTAGLFTLRVRTSDSNVVKKLKNKMKCLRKWQRRGSYKDGCIHRGALCTFTSETLWVKVKEKKKVIFIHSDVVHTQVSTPTTQYARSGSKKTSSGMKKWTLAQECQTNLHKGWKIVCDHLSRDRAVEESADCCCRLVMWVFDWNEKQSTKRQLTRWFTARKNPNPISITEWTTYKQSQDLRRRLRMCMCVREK